MKILRFSLNCEDLNYLRIGDRTSFEKGTDNRVYQFFACGR